MPLSAFNILIILHCSEQSVQSVGLNLRLYYLSCDSPLLVSNQETLVGESQLVTFCSLSLSITLHLIYPNPELAFRLWQTPRAVFSFKPAGSYLNYLAPLAITGLVKSRYTDMQLEIRCSSLLLTDTVDFIRILLEFSRLSFWRQTS